ncbi:MAG: hypothetical protein VX223_10340 [Myxococcota bacterium]|nr:hypothetical protein [Myxococcota bacterium]
MELIITPLAIGAGLFVAGLMRNHHAKRWREYAEFLQLEAHIGVFRFTLSGSKGPIEVEIIADAVPNQHYAAKLTITGSFPAELHLSRTRSLGGIARTLVGSRQVHIGDPDFDPKVWLQGNEAELRSIMNKQVRDSVMVAITQANISCDAYNLTWSIPRNASKTCLATLATVIELGVALSVDKTQTIKRLADNAVNDPVEEVQKRCLTLMANQYPHHDTFVEATRRLAHSNSHSVRLHARILAFQAGHSRADAHLLEFANNDSLDVHLRAEAWRVLGSKYHSERMAFIKEVLEPDILERLTSLTAEIAEMDLDVLRDHGSSQALGPLRTYLQVPELGVQFLTAARNAVKAIQSRTDERLHGAVMMSSTADGGEVDIAPL